MANLNPDERNKFAELAAEWWNPDGPCRTLHDINTCRLNYLASRMHLNGARVADIGCGGGILSEALARSGAEVIAIDATPELIQVARQHVGQEGLGVCYEIGTVESLLGARTAYFDAVICMELIEHVPDADALIKDCARLVKPNGLLVISTLNRTPKSYLFGIAAAEYVLGLLPRGTHDYAKFLKPSEVARIARQCCLDLEDVTGMAYNPITRKAKLSHSTSINYFATFKRQVPR